MGPLGTENLVKIVGLFKIQALKNNVINDVRHILLSFCRPTDLFAWGNVWAVPAILQSSRWSLFEIGVMSIIDKQNLEMPQCSTLCISLSIFHIMHIHCSLVGGHTCSLGSVCVFMTLRGCKTFNPCIYQQGFATSAAQAYSRPLMATNGCFAGFEDISWIRSCQLISYSFLCPPVQPIASHLVLSFDFCDFCASVQLHSPSAYPRTHVFPIWRADNETCLNKGTINKCPSTASTHSSA